MVSIGIDIGSTSAKAAVLSGGICIFHDLIPTGWSSASAAGELRGRLSQAGYDPSGLPCTATGYGRINVPYAPKKVTEITCHAKGAAYLFGGGRFTVIDIGGQDTKIISVSAGKVTDFIMNDKCSAGTGRFLEIMSNTLGTDPDGLFDLAQYGSGVVISSLCTVFAETEVVSLIGRGTAKEDIAHGIVESIADKVSSQCGQKFVSGPFCLTGGLCGSDYLQKTLSRKLGSQVCSGPLGRYAGAIGAALAAAESV
jgi:predicted CoA-substrate-specific enzyme activase